MLAVTIEFEGKTQRVTDLAKRFGVKVGTAMYRLKRGATGEAIFGAVTQPNQRDCVICGTAFQTPPSSSKIACSKACSRTRLSRQFREHGGTGTRLHQIWMDMRARCKGTAGELGRQYYSDRGIAVCEEWDSFEVFQQWAVSNGYGEELSIDRRDNNLGYSPDNCRWATQVQQMANTRKRADAKTSKFKGVSKHSQNDKWIAQGHKDGKPVNLGSFDLETDAAKAYDTWALQQYGEFARPNFKNNEVQSR